MPEQPTTQSPESDLARGLAEFRQGRKSLLPVFELPTDDMPEEEQTEISRERLIAYTYKKLIIELDLDNKLKDPNILQQLLEYLNRTKEAKIMSAVPFIRSVSDIKSMGINLPEVNMDKLNSEINSLEFLNPVTDYLVEHFELATTIPNEAAMACRTYSAIKSLGINLPKLVQDQIDTTINSPEFQNQLIGVILRDLEYGTKYLDEAANAIIEISDILSLEIILPNHDWIEIEHAIMDTRFLFRLTEDFNSDFNIGKKQPRVAVGAICIALAIQNIINHYSAIADEKEAVEAARRLQTAADRTGIPPRPETKAF